MLKWYEEVLPVKEDNYISSRVRFARNWDEYAFPHKLGMQEATELVGRLVYGLDDIDTVNGERFKSTTLDKMNESEKLAYKERRIMNATTAQKKTPVGLIISENEDTSVILNGDDHIRMQLLAPGQKLDEMFRKANALDDYINSRFNYAYDEKYGYLTSYPTNVGTGMRANAVLHLPTLQKSPQTRNLVDGLTRFGVTIRGVYGPGRENYGSLYDISNSKTLGMSEGEIVALVKRIADQLNYHENKAHEEEMKKRGIELKDEAFRAYGILKYARKMTLKAGLLYLSQFMCGVRDGSLELIKDCSIYALMLGIQSANLLQLAEKPLDDNELNEFRATYLRQHLPEIKEN